MSTPSYEFSVPQISGVNMPGESTDDDILENTKPNLISFSLSTTSSSFNTSPRSKANIDLGDKHDTEPSNKTYTPDNSIDLKSVNSGFTLEQPRSQNVFASALSCNTYSESSHRHIFQRRKQFSNKINSASSVPDLLNLFVDESNGNQTQLSLPRGKVFSLKTCRDVLGESRYLSMHNLNDTLNNSSSDLVRVASHPRVNKKSKNYLSQSLKNFSVKNKNHSYDYVDSKVKHYTTQCLKKNERRQLEETNSVLSQCNKHCIVSQLQCEIKELYEHLEERDKILKEVQANHHLLLLQYADAQNRLDELRLSSTAQRCIKSVQTESLLEGVNVTNLVNIQSTASKQSNIQDSNEGVYHGNTVQSDMYDTQRDDIVSEFNYGFQQLKETQIDLESNNSSCNENDMNMTTNAFVKVSEWCTVLPNQPLPVPSCYGSLGSSGNISFKHKEGLRFSSEILNQPNTNCIVKDLTNKNLGLSNVSSDLKHYPDTFVNFRNSFEGTLHKHFIDNLMPIENCTCLEYNKLSPEIQNTAAEVEKPLNLLNIPPLNLSDSLDSTYVCCSESCGDYRDFDEKQKCRLLISETQDVNIESANTKYLPVKEENFMNSKSSDTPTSYRSILIKSDVAKGVICNHCSTYCPITHVNQCDRREETFEKLTENFSLENKEDGRQKKSKDMKSHRFEDHSVPRISNYQQFPEFQKTVPDVLQYYLHNISLCAQDLKRKTEVIQGFLTTLLESMSDD